MAVVPLKGSGERKTRLAARLGIEERQALGARLFAHVAAVLAKTPGIGEVLLLTDLPPAGWAGRVVPDEGRGLNAELAAVAQMLGDRPMLVVHADLPLLSADDVAALLAAATDGIAIAPDREGGGTNAVALLRPAAFAFAFGPDSFALHLAAAGGNAQVVRREGLALDIDTPADLDAAAARGFAAVQV